VGVVVSVVIACRNAEDLLAGQLGALAAQEASFPWEVILVDNGSTDRSVEVAESFADRLDLTVVSAPERASQCYAQNVGAKVAASDTLVIVNADDEVAPGFVTAMHDALQLHDFVFAPSDVATLNRGWVSGAHDTTESTHGTWPGFAGGSAFGVSRFALDAIGGFPEEYGPTWDIAASIRLQQQGFELYRLPEGLLRYRYRTTIPALFRQTLHWGYYQTMVYRDFSAAVPARPLRLVAREWSAAVGRPIQARSKADLARCAVRFGYNCGRIKGSLRHRTLYL
jgi:glycosyltransferase involved in cell wall biosynthesis